MDYQTAFFGLLGLVFFECLRIYKCTSVGKHPIPGGRWRWHLLALVGLGVVSAFAAVALTGGGFGEAIFVGFSVPSGIKTLVSREVNEAGIDDMWEEDAQPSGSRTASGMLAQAGQGLGGWATDYFGR